MGKSAQSLYQQIALLPPAEQLVLAEHILSELDPSAAEVNKAWLAEAEKRLADWRTGGLASSSAGNFFTA